jgi:hypothetical protein
MPVLNPIDQALLPLKDEYREATKRARESRIPPFGQERLTKREARSRFSGDWKAMAPEKREAWIAAHGVDEILGLVNKKEQQP